MLSTNQLTQLTSLFTAKAIQEPLQTTLEKFSNIFSSKLEHFKVGSALLTLFQYDHTISDFPEYRLLAILFVLELYKTEQIKNHPFLALFGRLLNRVNSVRCEQPDEAAQNAQVLANGMMGQGQGIDQDNSFFGGEGITSAFNNGNGEGNTSFGQVSAAVGGQNGNSGGLGNLPSGNVGMSNMMSRAAAVAGANPTKNLNFDFDIFSNSALPILTDSERNILKSLMLEKLGIKTVVNRAALMKKSIIFHLSLENSENLKCNIELPVDIDVELMERREKLTGLVNCGVSSISLNERRRAGSMFDLALADERWRKEQIMFESIFEAKNSMTGPKSSKLGQNVFSSPEFGQNESVINLDLFKKIYHSNTENLIAPSASRIFRPIVRYPPPPMNFLIEDELAWCDLDEVSMDVHDFEYNFAQEDKWYDFLEIPSKVKLGIKTPELKDGGKELDFMKVDVKTDGGKVDAKVDLKKEGKKDVKKDAKKDIKNDAKKDSKTDVKKDAKNEPKNEPKTDLKKDSKSDFKNTIKSAKNEQKTEEIPEINIKTANKFENPFETNSISKLSRKKLKEQLKNAVKDILSSEDSERVCETLKTLEEPKDPAKLGILPEHMCDLINQNSLIAVELVVYIANYNLGTNKSEKTDKKIEIDKGTHQGNTVKEYLSVLVQDRDPNVDLLKSLETINRLTCRVTLPDEFLHLYISNLIVTVERQRGEGKFAETRRTVRLVCIFIRSLISTNCLGVKAGNSNIISEIQKFCVDFRDEAESVRLFRFIKTKMTTNGTTETNQFSQKHEITT